MVRFPWTPVSDEEHIERIRRSIALWDRFRIWLLFLYGAGLVAAVWALVYGIAAIWGIVPGNAGLPLLGFAVGTVLGYMIGWALSHLLDGIVFGLSGLRSERLLLRYHDILNPVSTQMSEVDNVVQREGWSAYHDTHDRP
jgi:hypothetical protein